MTEIAENKDTTTAAGPQGIGGWLIFIAIGVVIGPISIAATILPTIFDLAALDNWNLLTNPNSKSYFPYFAEIVIGEMVANSILFIASLALAVLFFRKHRWFVPAYITYVVASFVILLADIYILAVLVPDLPVWDEESVRGIFRSVFTLCVWVPYLLLSRRVKNTFVN